MWSLEGLVRQREGGGETNADYRCKQWRGSTCSSLVWIVGIGESSNLGSQVGGDRNGPDGGQVLWRWTNGSASVRLEPRPTSGEAQLVVSWVARQLRVVDAD